MLKFPLMGVIHPSFVLDISTPKKQIMCGCQCLYMDFRALTSMGYLCCLMPMLWRKSNCLAILLLAYSHVQLVNGEIPAHYVGYVVIKGMRGTLPNIVGRGLTILHYIKHKTMYT
jgi:hypothetical protein